MNRRRTILSVLLVLLAGSYVVATGIGTTVDEPGDGVSTVRESQLIQPVDNGSYLWPYTSRSASASGRTLAVNVIIYGPPDRTRTALVDSANLDWEPVNDSETDADAESYVVDDGVDWDDAAGSTRYSYVDQRLDDGQQQWVDESYQLHTGSYLGSRSHIRAYSPPSGEWTAIQVHEEYFDWFRLRHTVTDIHDSSRLIERTFIDQPFVDGVSRTYYGTTGGWNDGWITEIQLTVGLLLSTILAPQSRQQLRRAGHDLSRAAIRNRYGFLLAGALAGLLLGVRIAGIALETAIPTQSPQLFAGLLYPLIALGPPTLVALLAPRLRPQGAFGFTVAGLGAGFVYDFAAIDVGTVPLQLILHRLGLLFTLGLLAVGVVNSHNSGRFGEEGTVTESDPPLIVIACHGWFVGLGLPLFGYL